jgi:hypothetical protein
LIHTTLKPPASRSAKKPSASASERLTISACGESPVISTGVSF